MIDTTRNINHIDYDQATAFFFISYIDVLEQDCSNFITNAL